MNKSIFIVFLLSAVIVFMGFSGIPNGPFAYAESDMSYSFNVDGNELYMVNITSDGVPIGVRFGGYYFGASGIYVDINIYSDDGIDLNFPVNGSTLTAEQAATRDGIAQLFGRIHEYIVKVDELANTGYDGSKLPNGATMPLSDVYRYNHIEQYGDKSNEGYRLEIAEDTYNMLRLAREMYDVTQGAFNPAVYRLVDLWGFSSRIYSLGNFGEPYDREVTADEFWNNGYPLPDEKYIEAFSDEAFTDFSDNAVELIREGDRYFVIKKVSPAHVEGDAEEYGQWIDLGGVAKGYVADGIKAMLKERGLTRYNVNAGSSSMAYGLSAAGGSETLGLSDAFDPASALFPTSLLDVQVENCAVSTSGQNIRKYVTDGVEYAHILDGKTGAPAQTGVKSVMVVAPDDAGDNWAAKSDCLTTALTVMGRDGIVQFMNGYLRDNDIKIIVQYETFDGRKQLLTNYSQEEIVGVSDSFGEFHWNIARDEEDNYYYDESAGFVKQTNKYDTLIIVSACILGVAITALIVYHFVRGRNRTLYNVRHAKKDKPFKLGDIIVYMGVVLAITVLFFVFVFDTDDTQLQLVTVIDDQTGETLFVYNVTRDEYSVNTDNSDGWSVRTERTSSGLTVRFTKDFDGEERFNELRISRGRTPSVVMADSRCGFHQDCVRNFPVITRSGGAIVCSPNRIKVVTA